VRSSLRVWRRELSGPNSIEADEERLTKLLSEVEGKDINELIQQGSAKLASVPSGGGGGSAAPAVGAASGGGAAAAAEAAPEAKKEEEKGSCLRRFPRAVFDLLVCRGVRRRHVSLCEANVGSSSFCCRGFGLFD
jgi:ribosomal protein L12E/L44/L45/RPP1/RPP2